MRTQIRRNLPHLLDEYSHCEFLYKHPQLLHQGPSVAGQGYRLTLKTRLGNIHCSKYPDAVDVCQEEKEKWADSTTHFANIANLFLENWSAITLRFD